VNVLEPWEAQTNRMGMMGARKSGWVPQVLNGLERSRVASRHVPPERGNPTLRWRQFELELSNDIIENLETGPAIELGLTWFVDMADIAGAWVSSSSIRRMWRQCTPSPSLMAKQLGRHLVFWRQIDDGTGWVLRGVLSPTWNVVTKRPKQPKNNEEPKKWRRIVTRFDWKNQLLSQNLWLFWCTEVF